MSDAKIALLQVILQELPGIFKGIRDLFQKANPDSPAPTDAEVIALFNAACISSLLKDEMWLATHPETPDVSIEPTPIIPD